jgi:hypothetical protein
MSLPCLNIYRELFYPQGTKVVPNEIGEHLTAKGLAYWYMQDGYKQRNCVKFATNSFNDADLEFLIQALSSNFSLNCSLHKTSDIGKIIYVRRESMPRFTELVKPLCIPLCSINYLLNKGYSSYLSFLESILFSGVLLKRAHSQGPHIGNLWCV